MPSRSLPGVAFLKEYALDGKGSGFESDQDLFFFFKQKIFFQIKLSANYLSPICCGLSCHIMESFFFAVRIFI